MTLKAFHIRDKENSGEEACHEIVFAETAAQAKYISEAYSNGVPWTDISAVRKPQFDQYAETGIIPKSAYIADGWYFECDACGSFSATHENGEKVLCEDCYEEVKGDENA